jgi:hypothetical protein
MQQKKIGSRDMYNSCTIICCNNLETTTNQMSGARRMDDNGTQLKDTCCWKMGICTPHKVFRMHLYSICAAKLLNYLKVSLNSMEPKNACNKH